jgi:hypothetical protein
MPEMIEGAAHSARDVAMSCAADLAHRAGNIDKFPHLQYIRTKTQVTLVNKYKCSRRKLNLFLQGLTFYTY